MAAEHWIDACVVQTMRLDAVIASPRHRRLVMACDRAIDSSCLERDHARCVASLVRTE
jgi:hypothetical protein